ncbi:hypothetical protein HCH_03564 [Hahella chejuensis KCTC 2396]|uniref:Uncharacterized protein n=1 Tax=Hahella chejuensis (strain KCTC 2396) TaxID=349521 RepID=Q2SGB7_HAHCH|nr:hypothetical protein HCH_03564 [Hahella chejuensis KCTC 2396]
MAAMGDVAATEAAVAGTDRKAPNVNALSANNRNTYERRR